ncbi:MAG: CoA transferase, partial [Acidimicrobiales bacterium]
SEQTRARDMVANVEHPTAGPVDVVGIPFQMFGTPPAIHLPPPRLGQHSRDVLEEAGLDGAAIEQLTAAGVTTIEETTE